jgi:hypothetical protein
MHGRKARSDRIYIVPPECDADCVDPAHIIERQWGSLIKGRRLALGHRANIAKAARERGITLSPEAVADIKTCALTQPQYAEKWGISEKAVWKIQQGLSYLEFGGPMSSMLISLTTKGAPA